ncbi:hypothetical protein O1D97_17200 [Marinomonas sp. 15G1-11]|uniref:Uncharacterized protein n=1 Tax=Marinomonas phaeophyticola TaxID=3004091 RepID=A0ABT4JY21_9GAMM|nr:hypothetical protein [Marinomonas sp. 15G1-11]MCZ2723293.1 hypothetical protein [Marinomonas sp. 15G1-11]
MSLDKSLEQSLFLLLDDLENYAVQYRESPYTSVKSLKSALFDIYSILDNLTISSSSFFDWFLSNKSFLLSSAFSLSGYKSSTDAFLFSLVDNFRQNLSLFGFYHHEIEMNSPLQVLQIDALSRMLTSLKKEKIKKSMYSTYKSSSNFNSYADVTLVVNDLLNDPNVVEFSITGSLEYGERFVAQSHNITMEVATSYSLQLIEKKYTRLKWSEKTIEDHEASSFYKDVISLIQLYEKGKNNRSSSFHFNTDFSNFLYKRIELYLSKYTGQVSEWVRVFQNIVCVQKLENICLPAFLKNEFGAFLDERGIFTGNKKTLSLDRWNGKSYFSLLPCHDGIGGLNVELTSAGLGEIPLIHSYNLLTAFCSESAFLFDYDSLYMDVLIVMVEGSRYVIPKYQIQDVTSYCDDLGSNKANYFYSLYKDTSVLTFRKIDWTIVRKTDVNDHKDECDKKIVFIAQADIVFGVVCDFMSEVTIARKLDSNDTIDSLAAFWSTREGELLGEFTPINDQTILDVESLALEFTGESEPDLCDVFLIGIFEDTVFAIEKGVSCSIENTALDGVYELGSPSIQRYYIPYEGKVYPVVNLLDDIDDIDERMIQRGSFIFFTIRISSLLFTFHLFVMMIWL